MISQEQIAALELEHKVIAHIIGKNNRWEIVFRKPKRSEYKMYRASAHNPAKVADAQEILLRQVIVFPAKAAFDDLLDEYPGICDNSAVSGALLEMIGASAEEEKK